MDRKIPLTTLNGINSKQIPSIDCLSIMSRLSPYLNRDALIEPKELVVINNLLELCSGNVAHSDVSHLPTPHQVVERPQGLLQFYTRVPAVPLTETITMSNVIQNYDRLLKDF